MTWPVVALGDVAETALGKMLDRGRSRGYPHVPYLRNVNVQWGRIDTDDLLTMELGDEERERFGVRPGDLLVCEGGEIGRCAIWQGRDAYLAYQKALHRVRPGGALDARFLRYLFEHYATNGELASRATGTTIAHLPQQQLRRVTFPLPPLDEQRRIVGLLEDHLSRLDAAEAYLDNVNRRAALLADQVLNAALSTGPYRELPFGEVLESRLANGKSVSTKEGGFPVLRLTALKAGTIDLTQRKPGDWTGVDPSRFLVQHGDFLISRGNGSIRLVGRGGLVTNRPDPVAFPDTLIRARPDRAAILPEFLALVWNADSVRRQIEEAARTTAGIFKVNQQDLSVIRVVVPPLADQRRIVTAVSERRGAITTLTAKADVNRTRSGSLRRALLADAFSGQLSETADGPPAQDLLLAAHA